MATDLLSVLVPDFVHGCAIGRAAVGDDHLRIAIPFHCFLQEFQCGSHISGFGNIAFQDLAFVIYRAPEIVLDAIDFDEDLVDMPLPLHGLAHVVCSLFADLTSKVSAEAVDPKPDAFMANVDAALME